MVLSRISAIGAVAVCAGLAQATISVVGDARRTSAFATVSDETSTVTDGPRAAQPSAGEPFYGRISTSATLRGGGGARSWAEQSLQLNSTDMWAQGRASASANLGNPGYWAMASAESVFDLTFRVPAGSAMLVSLSSQNGAAMELLTGSGDTILTGDGVLWFTTPDPTLRLRLIATGDASRASTPGTSISEVSFSAYVRVVPTPGLLAILPAAGLWAMRRRRVGTLRPRP